MNCSKALVPAWLSYPWSIHSKADARKSVRLLHALKHEHPCYYTTIKEKEKAV
jgi:hypothetical protein